jgi:hypothetical protein
LSLKNTLNVDSAIAPFIDADARSAGATNSAYGIGCPSGPGMSPTIAPIPRPIESR